MMAAPSVYNGINAITADLAQSGIPKNRRNSAENYEYRSIDDVLDKLAPLLAKHRICVLPRARERLLTERHERGDELLFHVSLRVEFHLTSAEDGSSHVVEAFGEALDGSDKATAKAMSAAFKTAMLQTFCIPVHGSDDPDADSYALVANTHKSEPPQGWEQWSRDIADIVGVCESNAALDLVQERNRKLLKAISREKPELYRDLGRRFTERREFLRCRANTEDRPAAVSRNRRKSAAIAEAQHG
jgi:hypothetical protein